LKKEHENIVKKIAFLVNNKAANDTYLQNLAATVCGTFCCIAVWAPTTAPTQGYSNFPCSNAPLYHSNDATVAGCNVIAVTTSTPVWVSFSCSLATVTFVDVSNIVQGCDDAPFCAKSKNPSPTGLNIGPNTGCTTVGNCSCNSGASVDCSYTVNNFVAPQSRFNTGVDANGVPLTQGTIGDPHYTLTSVPATSTTQILVRTAAGGYPIPPWVGDDTLSAWIGPNNDIALDGPPGDYKYTTILFLNAAPVTPITFSASCDNTCTDLLINGHSIGAELTPPMPDNSDFNSFYTFTIPVGCLHFFTSGANTIDFVVTNGGNGGNPTGLRVEFQ